MTDFTAEQVRDIKKKLADMWIGGEGSEIDHDIPLDMLEAYAQHLESAQDVQRDAEDHSCLWSCNDPEESDFWEGSCGVAWQFFEGGPKENNVKFCPKCGRNVWTEDAAIARKESGHE